MSYPLALPGTCLTDMRLTALITFSELIEIVWEKMAEL